MSAPTLVPVDHSVQVAHSFDVFIRCRCGSRVYVGRVAQDRGKITYSSSGRLGDGRWHAHEPDGTMAGTVISLTGAIHILSERAHHDPET